MSIANLFYPNDLQLNDGFMTHSKYPYIQMFLNGGQELSGGSDEKLRQLDIQIVSGNIDSTNDSILITKTGTYNIHFNTQYEKTDSSRNLLTKILKTNGSVTDLEILNKRYFQDQTSNFTQLYVNLSGSGIVRLEDGDIIQISCYYDSSVTIMGNVSGEAPDTYICMYYLGE
jgi:hypothetical protein